MRRSRSVMARRASGAPAEGSAAGAATTAAVTATAAAGGEGQLAPAALLGAASLRTLAAQPLSPAAAAAALAAAKLALEGGAAAAALATSKALAAIDKRVLDAVGRYEEASQNVLLNLVELDPQSETPVVYKNHSEMMAANKVRIDTFLHKQDANRRRQQTELHDASRTLNKIHGILEREVDKHTRRGSVGQDKSTEGGKDKDKDNINSSSGGGEASAVEETLQHAEQVLRLDIKLLHAGHAKMEMRASKAVSQLHTQVGLVQQLRARVDKIAKSSMSEKEAAGLELQVKEQGEEILRLRASLSAAEAATRANKVSEAVLASGLKDKGDEVERLLKQLAQLQVELEVKRREVHMIKGRDLPESLREIAAAAAATAAPQLSEEKLAAIVEVEDRELTGPAAERLRAKVRGLEDTVAELQEELALLSSETPKGGAKKQGSKVASFKLRSGRFAPLSPDKPSPQQPQQPLLQPQSPQQHQQHQQPPPQQQQQRPIEDGESLAALRAESAKHAAHARELDVRLEAAHREIRSREQVSEDLRRINEVIKKKNLEMAEVSSTLLDKGTTLETRAYELQLALKKKTAELSLLSEQHANLIRATADSAAPQEKLIQDLKQNVQALELRLRSEAAAAEARLEKQRQALSATFQKDMDSIAAAYETQLNEMARSSFTAAGTVAGAAAGSADVASAAAAAAAAGAFPPSPEPQQGGGDEALPAEEQGGSELDVLSSLEGCLPAPPAIDYTGNKETGSASLPHEAAEIHHSTLPRLALALAPAAGVAAAPTASVPAALTAPFLALAAAVDARAADALVSAAVATEGIPTAGALALALATPANEPVASPSESVGRDAVDAPSAAPPVAEAPAMPQPAQQSTGRYEEAARNAQLLEQIRDLQGQVLEADELIKGLEGANEELEQELCVSQQEVVDLKKTNAELAFKVISKSRPSADPSASSTAAASLAAAAAATVEPGGSAAIAETVVRLQQEVADTRAEVAFLKSTIRNSVSISGELERLQAQASAAEAARSAPTHWQLRLASIDAAAATAGGAGGAGGASEARDGARPWQRRRSSIDTVAALAAELAAAPPAPVLVPGLASTAAPDAAEVVALTRMNRELSLSLALLAGTNAELTSQLRKATALSTGLKSTNARLLEQVLSEHDALEAHGLKTHFARLENELANARAEHEGRLAAVTEKAAQELAARVAAATEAAVKRAEQAQADASAARANAEELRVDLRVANDELATQAAEHERAMSALEAAAEARLASELGRAGAAEHGLRLAFQEAQAGAALAQSRAAAAEVAEAAATAEATALRERVETLVDRLEAAEEHPNHRQPLSSEHEQRHSQVAETEGKLRLAAFKLAKAGDELRRSKRESEELELELAKRAGLLSEAAKREAVLRRHVAALTASATRRGLGASAAAAAQAQAQAQCASGDEAGSELREEESPRAAVDETGTRCSQEAAPRTGKAAQAPGSASAVALAERAEAAELESAALKRRLANLAFRNGELEELVASTGHAPSKGRSGAGRRRVVLQAQGQPTLDVGGFSVRRLEPSGGAPEAALEGESELPDMRAAFSLLSKLAQETVAKRAGVAWQIMARQLLLRARLAALRRAAQGGALELEIEPRQAALVVPLLEGWAAQAATMGSYSALLARERVDGLQRALARTLRLVLLEGNAAAAHASAPPPRHIDARRVLRDQLLGGGGGHVLPIASLANSALAEPALRYSLTPTMYQRVAAVAQFIPDDLAALPPGARNQVIADAVEFVLRTRPTQATATAIGTATASVTTTARHAKRAPEIKLLEPRPPPAQAPKRAELGGRAGRLEDERGDWHFDVRFAERRDERDGDL